MAAIFLGDWTEAPYPKMLVQGRLICLSHVMIQGTSIRSNPKEMVSVEDFRTQGSESTYFPHVSGLRCSNRSAGAHTSPGLTVRPAGSLWFSLWCGTFIQVSSRGTLFFCELSPHYLHCGTDACLSNWLVALQ